MMYATKIKMKPRCSILAPKLDEIDSIRVGFRWYTKAEVYDLIKFQKETIKVDLSPFPLLIAVESPRGEKYVRSEPNDTLTDNLLKLPKEH